MKWFHTNKSRTWFSHPLVLEAEPGTVHVLILGLQVSLQIIHRISSDIILLERGFNRITREEFFVIGRRLDSRRSNTNEMSTRIPEDYRGW
jgi:hypothetical protein